MGGYSAIKSWVTSYTPRASNSELRHRSQGRGAVSGLGAYRIPRTRDQHRFNSAFLWLDADRLVADCLDDAAAGKVIPIPSKRYKVLMTICEHLPTVPCEPSPAR